MAGQNQICWGTTLWMKTSMGFELVTCKLGFSCGGADFRGVMMLFGCGVWVLCLIDLMLQGRG